MKLFVNQLIAFFSYIISISGVIAVCIFWITNISSSIFVSLYSLVVLSVFGFGFYIEYNERKERQARLNEYGVKFLIPTWFTNIRAFSNVCVYAISTVLFMISLAFIVERKSNYYNYSYSYTYSFNWGVMFLSLFFIMGLPLIVNYIGGLLFRASIEVDKEEILKLNGINDK